MVAIIFADQQVFDSEVTAFIQSASQLDFDLDFARDTASGQLSITPDLSIKAISPAKNDSHLNRGLTPDQLSCWYDKNKGPIREQLSTPFYKDWFYNLLNQLSDLPNKEKIISVLHRISRADGRVNISERSLITLAERHWGMR